MFSRTAFTPEFVDHARAFNGWPKEASIAQWYAARNVPFLRNNVYSRITRGMPASRKQISKVIAYLLDDAQKNDPERRALNVYLASRMNDDPAKVTLTQVLAMTTVAPTFLDVMGLGEPVLKWVFSDVVNPSKHVRLFEPDEEDKVREAIIWMYVEAGRHMVSPKLNSIQALAAGEKRIDRKLAVYQDAAVAWWRKHPWTVVQAVGPRKSLGMAIALPVRLEVYDRVRAGELRTYEVEPEDLMENSDSIIIEGLTMQPPDGPQERLSSPNLCLVMAMLCQQAWLSRMPGIGEERPLRLLTFRGTPLNARRAERFGYRVTGTFQRKLNIEFMERTLYLDGKGLKDSWLVGIWKGVQKHMVCSGRFDATPQPPSPTIVVRPDAVKTIVS